jgi:2-keto-4-pentenoate hydratase
MSQAWDDPRIRQGMPAQLAARAKRIAAGERPLGWKVGFGAPAALAKFGLGGPLVGFLMEAARVPPGGTVSLAGWVKPVAEPEIAVTIGRDVPGDVDRAGAAAAITAIGPAIELADMDPPPEDVAKVLEGDIFQRHVILGPTDAARAGCRLDGLTGVVTRSGAEMARTTELIVNTGDPVDTVRHVAGTLAAYGERLRAGDIIICGSVTPPVFLAPGDTGFGFALEPLGSVSVNLKS